MELSKVKENPDFDCQLDKALKVAIVLLRKSEPLSRS